MTKKIMSIAAVAALLTTGATAFDAEQTTGQLVKIKDDTTVVAGVYSDYNKSVATNALTLANPGALGDALIYPMFKSNNGWNTEFSVINTSSTEAVIAKVVLYSANDSRELRDFNIYLSANDVFRATLKDGKLVSTDSSTVAALDPNFPGGKATVDHGYAMTDSSTLASDSTPFETTLPEEVGYLAVYGMAQATTEGYHKKHSELWRDYRHLLDQCRSHTIAGGADWRASNALKAGIYDNNISVPNVATNLAAAGCQDVNSTLSATAKTVVFKSVDAQLAGSVILSASDSKGTRSMLLQATPMTNFTDTNQMLLWTEGELALIADRCIDTNATGGSFYKATCVEADATAASMAISNTRYEFGSAESKLILTQPFKRVLVQMGGSNTVTTVYEGETRFANVNNIGGKNVTDYGHITLGTTALYNDDEDKNTAATVGFLVSPADTPDAATNTIAPEMALIDFSEIIGDSGYKKGYAVLSYPAGTHGIVTQMTANEIDGTFETNWLYPATN